MKTVLRNHSHAFLGWAGGILVAVLILFAPAASADSFSLTDGTNLITFSLPASPTPTFFSLGDSFEEDGVSVSVNGMSETEDLYFYSAPMSGGLAIGDTPATLLNQQGAAVYSGTEDAPTFVPGVYTLTNLLLADSSSATYANDFTLTINGTSSSVPEPSSILLLGFGLMGLAAAGLFRKRMQHPSIALS